MKILLINVYNYRKGGSETVYFTTRQLLEAAGHKVVTFTLKWSENQPEPTSAYFPESKATRRGPLRQVVNMVNYFYHFEARRNLERLIEAEQPDVAHVHLIWGQLTPSILVALRKKGVPVVLTAHDYRIVCPAYSFRNGNGEVCEQCHGRNFMPCVRNRCSGGSLIQSAVMAAEQSFRNRFFNPARMTDGIIFVSDFAREIHLRYMPELAGLPLLTLHNIVPGATPCPKGALPPASESYFLYFGRLSAEKGLLTLVEAFASLPEARLRIAGTGPVEEQLRSFIESRRASNIELLGYRTGKPLRDLVAGANFTIVPSEWYENNPMSVIESYAAGVPVIGAETGGIPEIVADGITGFLFEPGNTASLKEAIRRASSLPETEFLKMSAAAADFAIRNSDPATYLSELTGFYSRVIAESRSR